MARESGPSPEEMAENLTKRTLNDAELIKGGAKYKLGEGEEGKTTRLDVTGKQIEDAKNEMGRRESRAKEQGAAMRTTPEQLEQKEESLPEGAKQVVDLVNQFQKFDYNDKEREAMLKKYGVTEKDSPLRICSLGFPEGTEKQFGFNALLFGPRSYQGKWALYEEPNSRRAFVLPITAYILQGRTLDKAKWMFEGFPNRGEKFDIKKAERPIVLEKLDDGGDDKQTSYRMVKNGKVEFKERY